MYLLSWAGPHVAKASDTAVPEPPLSFLTSTCHFCFCGSGRLIFMSSPPSTSACCSLELPWPASPYSSVTRLFFACFSFSISLPPSLVHAAMTDNLKAAENLWQQWILHRPLLRVEAMCLVFTNHIGSTQLLFAALDLGIISIYVFCFSLSICV